MNPQENHINYTAADIEKYWKGELTSQQRYAMEKAALEDPFLADAMEGYEEKIKPAEKISTDIDFLKQQLAERVADKQQAKVVGFGWWKIAAVFIVIAGAALVYTLMNKKENENDNAVAKNKTVDNPAPIVTKNDSAAVAKNDAAPLTDTSTLVAINKPKESKAANTSTIENEPAKDKAAPPASEPVASAAEVLDEKTKEKLAEADSVQYKHEDVAKFMEVKKKAAQAPVTAQRAKSFETDDFKSRGNVSPGNGYSNFSNTYSGNVVDKSNHPVANALVQIPNLNVATQTNKQGYFSFNAPDTSMSVSIASDGFETQQAIWRNKASLNQVILKPVPAAEQDVVVQSNGAARKQTNVNDISIKIMDAEPVDGWVAFNTYLEKNKRIPAEFKNLHGTVVVSFEVHNKWINNFTIDQSLDEDLDAEAIRLVRDGPKWKLLKGKKANVSVVINF